MSKVRKKLIKFGHYGLFGQNGFTLIELLIVIAIIGILALIILMALMNSRKKGQDTRIKSDVNEVRMMAQILYDNQGGKYRTSATVASLSADTSISTLIVDAATQYGNLIVNNTVSEFAAGSLLNTTPVSYYCVDSKGNTKVGTTALVAQTVCP